MADPQEKWDDNAPGRFYVDKECILCSLCVDLAPDSFKESDQGDHDVVHEQPKTEEQIQAATEAMEQCPVNAIGDDG